MRTISRYFKILYIIQSGDMRWFAPFAPLPCLPMMRLELGPQRDANRQVPLVRCPSIAVVCEKILEDPCLNCLENGGTSGVSQELDKAPPHQFQDFVFGGHTHIVSYVSCIFWLSLSNATHLIMLLEQLAAPSPAVHHIEGTKSGLLRCSDDLGG